MLQKEQERRDDKAAKARKTETEKRRSEEDINGRWRSRHGECHFYSDKATNQLMYEEVIGEGSYRLKGSLKYEGQDASGDNTWMTSLAFLRTDEGPCEGAPCEGKPETIGDIKYAC